MIPVNLLITVEIQSDDKLATGLEFNLGLSNFAIPKELLISNFVFNFWKFPSKSDVGSSSFNDHPKKGLAFIGDTFIEKLSCKCLSDSEELLWPTSEH